MGLLSGSSRPTDVPSGQELVDRIKTNTQNWEEMGLTDLLIPQRWWGTGEEIEGSSFDCLAMTTFLAAHTKKLNHGSVDCRAMVYQCHEWLAYGRI
jgi:uncharacterized lipoprotein YddW (UPF0748 family)